MAWDSFQFNESSAWKSTFKELSVSESDEVSASGHDSDARLESLCL